MKVIIAGSRTITDVSEVEYAMGMCGFDATEIVCGCAAGVDALGEEWAIHYRLPVKHFPADWKQYGKRAGPLRNKQMADYAEALVLVWDGKSKGSLNMLETALKKKLKVFSRVI